MEGLKDGKKDLTGQRNDWAKAWRLEKTYFPVNVGHIMFVGSQGCSIWG